MWYGHQGATDADKVGARPQQDQASRLHSARKPSLPIFMQQSWAPVGCSAFQPRRTRLNARVRLVQNLMKSPPFPTFAEAVG